MTEYKKIAKLIDHMILYVKSNNNAIFDNYIDDNIDMYTEYVMFNGILSKDNFKFLFDVIKSNPNTNPTIIYNIFKLSQISFDHNVYISKIITKIDNNTINKDIFTVQYLHILNTMYEIEPIPKFINILWNVENRNEQIHQTTISTTTKTIMSPAIKIKYVSYHKLFDDLYTNKNQYLFKRQYIIYDNLNRILGVPLSSNNYKLNYFINISTDLGYLNYNIYDSISTKHIIIHGVDKFYINNIKDIINTTINLVVSFIISNHHELLYERLFCCCYFLHCYFIKLFQSVIRNNVPKLKMINNFTIFTPTKNEYKYIPCQHVDEYKNVFKQIQNFFNNYNKFIDKFIYFSNNIAICKICGESLEMFNFVEANYLQSDGIMIITSSVDNIFQYDIYSKLINAELFLSDYMSIYDGLFGTNTIDDFNNTARLIIDFMISINTNRLEYQQTYASQIQSSGLFFVRLTNNIFIEYNEKEQYSDKRNLNIITIITIVLILVTNFNDLVRIIKSKKIKFDNDLNISINTFIINTVTEFLIKQGLIQKNNSYDMSTIVNTYLEILTEELKSHYNILVIRFFNHINVILLDEIEISDTPMAPVSYTSNIISIPSSFDIIDHVADDIVKTVYYNYEFESSINMDLDTLNIKEFEIFTTADMSIELKTMIANFDYEYIYKNINVTKIIELDKDTFYLDDSQKYFFTTNFILEESPFKITSNAIFKLLNFGDSLPFLTLINSNHCNLLLNAINVFLNIYFPRYRFVYHISFMTREYWHYVMYNLLYYVINGSPNEWLNIEQSSLSQYYKTITQCYVSVKL